MAAAVEKWERPSETASMGWGARWYLTTLSSRRFRTARARWPCKAAMAMSSTRANSK